MKAYELAGCDNEVVIDMKMLITTFYFFRVAMNVHVMYYSKSAK